MAPSPAPWAVLGDVLWCLGLGCLLAGVRDAVRLALGEGALRCFFRDIAAFAAAAVLVCGFAAGASAGGLPLRADTHADNIYMQRALTATGFVRCGTIYTEDGTPRLAYYHRRAD